MEKEFLKQKAMLLKCEKIKRKRKAGLSSIGENENSLYYAVRHREEEVFYLFRKYYEEIKGALVKNDADFFSLKVYGAARISGDMLLLNRICTDIVEYTLDENEIILYLRYGNLLNISELLAFPSFLRRAYLKELAKCAKLIRRADKKYIEAVEERIERIVLSLKNIKEGSYYVKRASRNYAILAKIRGFKEYTEESLYRCLSEFSKLQAKSKLSEIRCAQILANISKDATADVFLMGNRRNVFIEELGLHAVKDRKVMMVRILMIGIPAFLGVFLSMLFDGYMARPLYIFTLSICVFIPIFSYATDFVTAHFCEKQPCSVKTDVSQGEIKLRRGSFIEKNGENRLNGIKILYNCKNVLTESRAAFEYLEKYPVADMFWHDSPNRLFYSLFSINMADSGLFTDTGEGDIYDGEATVFFCPPKTIIEHLKMLFYDIKQTLILKSSWEAEALMKLAQMLRHIYPICALMLIIMSYFQTTVGDVILMQLCAIAPPILSGWLSFGKKVDELLKQKGSGVRAVDIKRVLRRSFFASGAQIIMFPSYAKMLIAALAKDNVKFPKKARLIDYYLMMKGSLLYGLIQLILAFAVCTNKTPIILSLFWFVLYLFAPLLSKYMSRV